MESAQNTFISSTFWTERIGPAAALKTLEVMERESSWDTVTCWADLDNNGRILLIAIPSISVTMVCQLLLASRYKSSGFGLQDTHYTGDA